MFAPYLCFLLATVAHVILLTPGILQCMYVGFEASRVPSSAVLVFEIGLQHTASVNESLDGSSDRRR